MNHTWTIYESPLGPLTLAGGAHGLARIDFPGHSAPLDEARRDHEPFRAAVTQLEEYFAGRRRHFELALNLGGTPFQRSVWEQLLAIPYGATRSYGELARRLGHPDQARALGAAVGRTPVPIVVPCHRAVGASGDLTGYRGGLDRKRALLDLEIAVTGAEPTLTLRGARQLTLV